MSETENVGLLIVDDEPDVPALMRQLLRRQVRAGNYTLTFAEDGVSALETLVSDPSIAVVLTDLNMPRMDGLSLLGKMSELDRIVKAVVVTAYGDMENIRTAMNRGAFDFLTKPINVEDLTITLENAASSVRQQKRTDLLRLALGRYVSSQVVNRLLSDPEAANLGGEKRAVSILISDLRGFSQISERLAPELVLEVLNVFLGEMTDIISEYDGTVNEFVGDGILALFGAPIALDDHADRAVACALSMQQAMSTVNERLADNALPVLSSGMGIGINSGEVVVGNVGSTRRMKYTPVGSNVNLASRIETYTVGGQILISESTRTALSTPCKIGRMVEVALKGFMHPVPLLEVEALGPPYNLTLPEVENVLHALDVSIPVRFTVFDGKHLTGEHSEGLIVALSRSSACLESETEMPSLSNLKMEFLKREDEEAAGEVYAKAVRTEDAGVILRFTAVPDEVSEHIRQFLPST